MCYFSMDLQQIMSLPKLSTSCAYCLRQLNFYSFGIHAVMSTGTYPYFCTWTEDVAKRGSVEVLSRMFRFLESLAFKKKQLVIWSDSCAGQNKNFNTICFYQLLVAKGLVEIIDHKFPEIGHTYMDSDRDFGRIEKVSSLFVVKILAEAINNIK